MADDSKLAAVSAALSRAHHASRYGSTEAQAGAIGEAAAYVQAILTSAQDATRSWSNWLAINDQLSPEHDTAEAIAWLGLAAIGDIRKALARDAILGGYRLSDHFAKDRVTLCRLAEWLQVDSTRDRLAGRDWAIDLGYQPAVAKDAAADNAKRIDRIRSLVVTNWKVQTPDNSELGSLRDILRPTRNHLAHALDTESISVPTMDQTGRFLALTLDLATDAAFIWLGSAVPADRFREFSREQAAQFWSHAFAAPIEMWSRDMERRRQAGIS